MNAYINFSVNAYIPSNMERGFWQTLISTERLLPDASNFWLLLFIWSKQKASRRERLLRMKRVFTEKPLRREYLKKMICFSFNIWLQSKISWVEKLRNSRLNINNKKLCCLTQTARDVQKSQFLVLYNYWIASNRYQDYLKSHLYSLTLGGLVWSAVISDDLGCL